MPGFWQSGTLTEAEAPRASLRAAPSLVEISSILSGQTWL
jgi:hypothetical protein